jgi:hypothetical protein
MYFEKANNLYPDMFYCRRMMPREETEGRFKLEHWRRSFYVRGMLELVGSR